MKKYPKINSFVKTAILLLTITLLIACDKDEPTCQGVDCLPPATQTGAGTFGCLVNGVPYVDNSGRFNCFYQLVNGKYYFNLTANFLGKTPKIISLATNALIIERNNTYPLFNKDIGNFYAEVTFDNNPPTFLNDNTTNNVYTGIIIINMFNFDNRIISGLFNFKIEDTINNKTYNITEGRFDAKFTQ